MINHPNVIRQVYELEKIIEFDIELSDVRNTLRIELFRNLSEPRHFRAHIWGSEFFRIQSSFPRDRVTDQPAHEPSDEIVLVDYSHYLSGDYRDFEAESLESAAAMILDDCRRFLNHISGQNKG
jgi:hypothetical protein